MSKEIGFIREFPNGRKYELTYQGVITELGEKVKESRWMSLDKNPDGKFDIKDYICAIPPGEKDISLTTLSMQCFTEK
ncbi:MULTISPECIES: hypothetical protein [Tenacibaculum]|uniref:Uncharacterized protein n=1 Tax=Tenacibaculum piscium TaxID=1458515 RepID=A0A2H1YHL4_9FLAO|nr:MULTISPECIES: hypothetical protein [Tenacibaculum]MBE7630093.1 hypothetical protein [Tenacibaculum piscium]MCG8868072.1 hypothetical protein [Tenacibaculum finnmarkense]SOS74881.1 conserved hypothetical protein [Tenacibaculum piscium]